MRADLNAIHYFDVPGSSCPGLKDLADRFATMPGQDNRELTGPRRKTTDQYAFL